MPRLEWMLLAPITLVGHEFLLMTVLHMCCVVLAPQVRSVRSVTAVCHDRALALQAHMAAKHDLDTRKVWHSCRASNEQQGCPHLLHPCLSPGSLAARRDLLLAVCG